MLLLAMSIAGLRTMLTAYCTFTRELYLLNVWHNQYLAISAIMRSPSDGRFDITDRKTVSQHQP